MTTNQLSIFSTEPVTMTSRELAEYTGKRHDNVLQDIKTVLTSLGKDVLTFQETYLDKSNRKQTQYRLDREMTYVLLTGYSAPLRLAVIRRLDELEQQVKFKLPDFNNPAIAARAWADMADKAQELFLENNSKQEQLELAAPKVDFVDSYTNSDGLFGFREVAKLLNIKETTLRAFLVRKKIMYNLNGTWMAYQPHIENKRFCVKTGLYAVNKAYATCMFTTKGLYDIHAMISKEHIDTTLALMD
jgi:Rha family phage regulatory protein